jgi:hypothetical protein
MPIWSAYFYLFAMAGAALLIAGIAEGLTPVQRSSLVAGLVLLHAEAGSLDQFSPARGAWSWQSHVNRHYVDRSQGAIGKYLKQLRSARPALPPRSTVFFGDVPVSLGWQAGNGPLIRWAYRDSSLRSYFLTEFSGERAARGPVFFFVVERDSLEDKTASPTLLPSLAYSMLLADRPRAAIDVHDMALKSSPASKALLYWRAWAHWGAGDTLAAASDFQAVGLATNRILPRGTDQSLKAVQDTSARVAELASLRSKAVLNPWVHARLAALFLASPQRRPDGVVEAYAFRLLAPEDPDSWRKWSSAQLAEKQFASALSSLEHYLALSGPQGNLDQEAQKTVVNLRRIVRGDLAQIALQAD